MDVSVLDICYKKPETSEDKQTYFRARKSARLASGATVGAAVVEAENSLEIEVRFYALGQALLYNSNSSSHFRYLLSVGYALSVRE